MFLQQAWGIERQPTIGIKGFDENNLVNIKETSTSLQKTVFFGTKSAKKYSRERALELLSSYGIDDLTAINGTLASEPNNEFAFHRFLYQSGGSYFPLFDCFVRTRAGSQNTFDVVAKKDLAKGRLGFYRQKLASRGLLNLLTELHQSRSATEDLARTLLNEDKGLRVAIKSQLSHYHAINKDQLAELIDSTKRDLHHA